MNDYPSAERRYCQVDRSTYERERETRLLLEELNIGDGVVLRRKNTRQPQPPFAWDVFSLVNHAQLSRINDLFQLTFGVFIRDQPETWQCLVQNDGLMVSVKANGMLQEEGYLLASSQRLETELEEFLAAEVPISSGIGNAASSPSILARI